MNKDVRKIFEAYEDVRKSNDIAKNGDEVIYDTMLCESMNANMDDPKDLILHIRHARKMGDYQKVKSLTNRLRTVAMRMDMLDDPDILDIIGDEEEDNTDSPYPPNI